MKKLNVMLLAAVFAISSIASANTSTEPSKLEADLAKEVAELLKKPSFKVAMDNDVKAMVTFTLNEKDEIVVLSVDSDSYIVEDYIKSRLNYQKVDADTKSSTIKFFKMPVRLVGK